MFNNVGSKLKTIAVISFVIDLIGFVVLGIITISEWDMPFLGLIAILGGILVSLVIAYLLYGFGQLVENAEAVAEEREKVTEKRKASKVKQETKTVKSKLASEKTGEDEYIDIVCADCGEQLSFRKEDFLQNDKLYCPACDAVIETKNYR